VSEEELQEVAMNSGVLEVETDFLEEDFRAECERVLPYPSKVEPSECRNAFLYLKETSKHRHSKHRQPRNQFWCPTVTL
jgi:hypothetical protein